MSKTVFFHTSQGVKLQFESASALSRIVAFSVDVIIYFLSFIIIKSLLSSSIDSNNLVYFVLGIFYFFLPLLIEIWTNGQSIGKIIMKIQVISNYKMQADKSLFFSRYVIKIIELTLSFGILPVLFIGFSKRGQSFADYFAGALVVNKAKQSRFKLKDLTEISTKDNYEITFPQVTKLKENDIIILKNLLQEHGKLQSQRSKALILKASKRIQDILEVKANKLSGQEFLSKIISDYIVSTR